MYRLRSLCSGHVQLVITDGEWSISFCQAGDVWVGKLSKSEVESSASDVGQSPDVFTETALCIFSNSCPEQFVVDLESIDSGDINLSWKKITEDGVKFSLGNVLLEKQRDPMEGDSILANASKQISNSEKEIKSLKARNLEVESHNERISAHLEEFTRQKVELESELFTKFAIILNEKKKKIRALKERLHQFESSSVGNVDSTEEKPDGTDQKKLFEKKDIPEDHKKRKTHSAKITVGDEFELNLSKISRRETRQKKSNITTRASTSTASIPAKCATVSEHKNDAEVAPPKDGVDCDDTVDANDLLDDL